MVLRAEQTQSIRARARLPAGVERAELMRALRGRPSVPLVTCGTAFSRPNVGATTLAAPDCASSTAIVWPTKAP